MKKTVFLLGCLLSLHLSAQQAGEDLEKGNILFHVQNKGVIFQKQGNPAFEVPKGAGIHGILSSGLWIGGKDSSGGLRISVASYDTSSGQDFQPGPIDLSTALPDDAAYWNYVWRVDSAGIESHKTLFNNTGYTAPWGITNWPGTTARPGNYNPVLAPFIDLNGNNRYEPELGEVPFITGNEAAYVIFNDGKVQNRQSGTMGMGVEVYGMVYTDASLPHVVFVKYSIVNRSFSSYDSVFSGIFTDFMLGNAFDNYTSTDTTRKTYFCYNSEAFDSNGYGDAPPIIGVKFLRGRMDKTIGFNYDASHQKGMPASSSDYYHSLKAEWRDGSELMDPISGQKDYLYLGDPCNGSGWTEYGSSGVLPGRRNMLGVIGPQQLNRGDVISIDVAYIFTQKNPNLLDNVCEYYADADAVQQRWNNVLSSVKWLPKQGSMALYPNPASQQVNWSLPENTVIAEIRMISSSGQQTLVEADKPYLNTAEYPNGVYILQITDGLGNVYREKLLIQH